jgi:Flp pilus assembly protein TadG
MRMTRLFRSKRDPRGQSVVEFALVLPILLLVVFGITEFGRALMTANMLTQAAREGARVAALGYNDAAVNTRVTEVLTAANITATSVVITPDSTGVTPKVEVAVSSLFESMAANVLPFTELSLTGRAVMRIEN